MSRNDDYTTGNLLYFPYHRQNYYKLNGIHLSKQTNTTIPRQVHFMGELEEDGVTMLFFLWKAAKNRIQNNINNGTSKNIKFIEWTNIFKLMTRKLNIVKDQKIMM